MYCPVMFMIDNRQMFSGYPHVFTLGGGQEFYLHDG